ncbi:MAG: L-aspartate oxidase [uncultured Thermomicrobiales bacterium]|uniref:L-aspartate oxidase n=1 Tax=uncultured Thermomicrobiales bacterium TaxID=1645740 RepID=A0A6J4TY26_9BACT|nr:MAG: L-aspartate oxidase [uncultured Thermomicrobiales bacterium]
MNTPPILTAGGPGIPASLLRPTLPDPAQPRARYDAVVVGAGVAGLAFALRLPEGTRIALLTKGALGESNTRYAQGGLAAAVGPDDDPALHEADTLAAGAGLCDADAVRRLVEGGPAAVEWLLAMGTRFDRDPDGTLALGREAAHGRRRVLHAGGDATGAEIERALVAKVRERPAITVLERAYAVDLVQDGGRCTGLVAELGAASEPVVLRAPVVVLAAGGAGQLWATTSNPLGATADGLAMALRAGVAVADLEFAQFHPTVLRLPDDEPFLVSEAVRGEGAFLRDADGERFMPAAHPLAELAPRDVVARAIQRQMGLDGADHVALDLAHLDPDAMRARFPTIAAALRRRGLDLATDRIPVAPAAHYFMGGVVASPEGRTSLPGLLAIGEAACTGVHGANRLASNSLLEGLVFGMAAADAFEGSRVWGLGSGDGVVEPWSAPKSGTLPPNPSAAVALRSRVQRAMSRHVAVVRDAAGLAAAGAEIAAVAAAAAAMPGDGRAVHGLRSMALAASAVVAAAYRREESRGGHFRLDFPDSDPALGGRHLLFGGGEDGWRYGGLG